MAAKTKTVQQQITKDVLDAVAARLNVIRESVNELETLGDAFRRTGNAGTAAEIERIAAAVDEAQRTIRAILPLPLPRLPRRSL